VEELEEFCLREVEAGIHSSGIRPGVLKAASSARELTDTEKKAIKAVARVQEKTGLLINTHANTPGAFRSQLELIESEGVDPKRVCLGHTQRQLVEEWDDVRECMKRGAVFSLDGIEEAQAEKVKRAFYEGLGGQIVLGRDSGFKVGYTEYYANPKWRRGDSVNLTWFGEGPPFTRFFSHILPYYMKFGITEQMLEKMLVENPRRILPVQ
jgi:phosphotriesterase-related protein